jgi:ubiquitin carboxyl-terminal hydrolase 4/11/15
MGGAADFPQRASSPLKRRASDLEAESSSSQKDDVDMINVPESEPPETVDASTETSARRAQSVDMLKDDQKPDTQTTSIQTPEASPPKETGSSTYTIGTLSFSEANRIKYRDTSD